MFSEIDRTIAKTDENITIAVIVKVNVMLVSLFIIIYLLNVRDFE